MRRITGIAFSMVIALIAFGCGGSSSALQLPPPSSTTPSISSVSPTTVVAGSPDVTLTVTGSNFDGTGVIRNKARWSANGTNTLLATTVNSSVQLTAVVPATLLISPGIAEVAVEELDTIEGTVSSISNSVNFSITSAAAGAISVSPSSVTLGPKGTRQFVAMMSGNPADAKWEIAEGAAGGSITSTGLYTVSEHLGTFHVIATPVVDSSRSASATVSVVASGFQATGSMGAPRSGHAAVLLASGKVLIVGGADASAESFDPATETFSVIGRLLETRLHPSVTLLSDGRVLIAGGVGSGTVLDTGRLATLNTAEILDPATGVFVAAAEMIQARVGHTATLLPNGKVLIAGGSADSGFSTLGSTELFDPATNTFSQSGFLISERVHHTATLLNSGKVLIAGGWNGHAPDAPDDPPWDPLFVELYDPQSGGFAASVSMSTTRIAHSAIRLGNAKVLVLGGIPALQNVHEQPPDPAFAELYDSVAQTFTSLATRAVSRNQYSSTLLNDGKVLLGGGESLGNTVSIAELFDPASGSIAATGGLVTARKGHTATRLQDGRVLVVGGTDSRGNALASAEIYQ